MNILICSHYFYPDIGGIELNSQMLASEFATMGHHVKVVTWTANDGIETFPFRVVRQPTPKQMFDLVRWSDVFFQNNTCLQMSWPLLFVRRPWVISHHTWMTRAGGSTGWQDQMKRFLLRYATNIVHSRAMAEHIGAESTVIGIPYREELFSRMPVEVRDTELAYLGRLVSDKGVDILIEALASLRYRGLTPRLTIVGAGEETVNIQKLVCDKHLQDQVCFAGSKTGAEAAQILNSHQILVIPSRWQEPFSVVALEGAACGCMVVASEGGGMRDAVGACGVTFPNGNVDALADTLFTLLTCPEQIQMYTMNAKGHLAKHRKSAVAQAHLAIFQDALQGSYDSSRASQR